MHEDKPKAVESAKWPMPGGVYIAASFRTTAFALAGASRGDLACRHEFANVTIGQSQHGLLSGGATTPNIRL